MTPYLKRSFVCDVFKQCILTWCRVVYFIHQFHFFFSFLSIIACDTDDYKKIKNNKKNICFQGNLSIKCMTMDPERKGNFDLLTLVLHPKLKYLLLLTASLQTARVGS